MTESHLSQVTIHFTAESPVAMVPVPQHTVNQQTEASAGKSWGEFVFTKLMLELWWSGGGGANGYSCERDAVVK